MIKIGTCGYSFRDWKGSVYPVKIKNSEILSYYNKELGFDLVEIDSTYYSFISRRSIETMVDNTTDSFLFAAKCHRAITLNEMGKVRPSDIDNTAVFTGFLESFAPMIESGKLLTFLAQFGPVFFKNRENVNYLLKLRKYFKDLPLTIEFRHKSWLSEEHRESTFKLLRENNLSYAVVDEPCVRSLAPLVVEATTDLGYVRLHGRNKNWFDGGQGDRYDYFYTDEELSEFIPIARELEMRTRLTAIFFNNCHAGAALKNAIKLRQLLGITGLAARKKTNEQMSLPLD